MRQGIELCASDLAHKTSRLRGPHSFLVFVGWSSLAAARSEQFDTSSWVSLQLWQKQASLL